MVSANRLKQITLGEISLVDNPANEHAKVVLFKNHPDKSAGTPGNSTDSGGNTMDIKELEKKLGELETQNAELTKQADTLKSEKEAAEKSIESMEKAATDAGFEVEKSDKGITITKKADPEYVVIDGEKVEKGSVPKAVLKRLESLEKSQEAETLAKRARDELPNLGGTDEAKGKLLKYADSLEQAERDDLLKSLKAADHAVSKMFDEIGKTGNDDENSAAGRLNKMVSEFQKSNPDKSYHQAYAEVTKTKEGAELLKQAEEDE